MSNPRPETLKCTAYHEAGHAVIGYRFRHAIRRATIIPEGDALGLCERSKWLSFRPDVNGDARTARLVQERIIVLFAGGVAEAKYRGRRNHIGASSDYRTAVALADHVCGSAESVEKYLAWLAVVSKDHVNVSANWKAIQAVAKELLAKRTLNGKEIRAIIQDG